MCYSSKAYYGVKGQVAGVECLSNQIQTPKTVTRTIRISRDVVKELQQIASTEKVSVNSLINQALLKFVEWDHYADKFGFAVALTPRWMIFARLLSFTSDQEAARLGRWAGRNVAKEFTIFWFKEFPVRTALKSLELLGSRYARRYEYVHNTAGKEHVVILNHGMGRQWSFYYEYLVRTVFGELLGKKVRIERMKNQVMARIQE